MTLCKENKSILVSFLLLFVPLIYLINSLLMVLGLSIQNYVIVILIAIYGLFHKWRLPQSNIASIFLNLVIFTLLVLLTMFVASCFLDMFYDSRAYHGQAVIYLSEGWNPYYAWKLDGESHALTVTTILQECYTKSYWVVGALLYKLTNHIEVIHTINIFLFLSSIIAIRAYFWHVSPLKNKRFVYFISTLLAANPIVMAQLFSGYIDGALSSTLAIVFFFGLAYIYSRKAQYLVYAGLYIPFLVNIKFTALVYLCVLGVVLVVLALIKDSGAVKKIVMVGVLSAVLGVFFFGFNPYVTNTITYKNPLYPAVQFDNYSKKNVMDGQAAPEFLEKNRFEKFLIAQFSIGSKEHLFTPEFSIPFTKILYRPSVDTRFSGYGPLSSELIILVLVLLLFVTINAEYWVVIIGIIFSVFTTEASWWARLSPQFFWVIILIPCYALISQECSRAKKHFCYFIFALTIVNTSIIFMGNLTYQALGAARLNQLVTSQKFSGLKIIDDRFFVYSIDRLQTLGLNLNEFKHCHEKNKVATPELRGLVLCKDEEGKNLEL